MMSSQFCPGHWLAHISATIYLQPFQIGLGEDWEGHLLIGDGICLNLTENLIYETKWMLDGLIGLSVCFCLLGAMGFTLSAKYKWLQVSSSAKPLTKIRKRRCPRTKPWGTPLFTVPSLEWWSPKFTLLFKTSSTKRLILRWIHFVAISLISRRWYHVSNFILPDSPFITFTSLH